MLAASVRVPEAQASRSMILGLFDDAETIYNGQSAFPIFRQLRVKWLRVTLRWGGQNGVARRRPRNPSFPGDRAYNWAPYDRVVLRAKAAGIRIIFSIYGTPGWANGGRGLNRLPNSMPDLEQFAYAAAWRYGGTWRRRDNITLPAVKHWIAWNEPNNPVFLSPQWRREGVNWVMQAPANYRKICEAIYFGVHTTALRGEKVACGVTAPRGNNDPRSVRPSIAPIAFLRALRRAGLRAFDAYAHHPYYGSRQEAPGSPPRKPTRRSPTPVTLGNIGALTSELGRLYGKGKPLWITEYGYQTNPPDRAFGVSWAKQARYLTQAVAIARRNPRIQMMLWFLLRDEPVLSGWQSGFLTVRGKKKPAFEAFRKIARG